MAVSRVARAVAVIVGIVVVACSSWRGVVGDQFTRVGEAIGNCQFRSTPSSPFTFNFDLTLLNTYEEDASSQDVVIKETPGVGHEYLYYANPCDELNVGTTPGFTGTCTGDMAVCFCSTDFGKCESIANRNTVQWLVPTSLSETQTVLQNFSAPNCDSDPSRDWVTYIIYKCDESSMGYGKGTAFNAHSDQYGVCIPDNSNDALCTQCIEWSTNYVCNPFPSENESYLWLREPNFVSTIAVVGGSTEFIVVTRDQFRNAFNAPGLQFDVNTPPGVGFTQTYLADGMYKVVLTADGSDDDDGGAGVNSQYEGTFNITVVGELNSVTMGWFELTIAPGHGSGNGPSHGPNHTLTAIIVILVVGVVLGAGVVVYFKVALPHIQARRRAGAAGAGLLGAGKGAAGNGTTPGAAPTSYTTVHPALGDADL